MRLIDADNLIPMIRYATIDSEVGIFPILIGFDAIKKVVDEAPTIEAKTVRHGKWIYTGFMEVKCNNCGNVFHELEDTNYCPHCGYKMDLDEVEK